MIDSAHGSAGGRPPARTSSGWRIARPAIDHGPQGKGLYALVDLAPTLVPGCDLASLTRWTDGAPPLTLHRTDDAAAEIDRFEFTLAEGPTVSGRTNTSFHKVNDFAFDRRWPVFGEAVTVNTGVRSAMSYQFVTSDQRATLTLYGCVPDAFAPAATAPAAMFAVHVRSLLGQAFVTAG